MLSPWTLNSWSSRPHSCPPFGSSRRSPAGERCSHTEMFKEKVRALLRAISDCTRPSRQSPNRCKHPRVWWNLTLYVIFPGRCISTNLLLFSHFIGDNTNKTKTANPVFLFHYKCPKRAHLISSAGIHPSSSRLKALCRSDQKSHLKHFPLKILTTLLSKLA